jgi:hypothetical protein
MFLLYGEDFGNMKFMSMVRRYIGFAALCRLNKKKNCRNPSFGVETRKFDDLIFVMKFHNNTTK